MNPQDVEYEHDRYFLNWLGEINASLIMSSYKSGSTITISRMELENRTHVGAYLNTFDRVTGMFYRDGKLWVGATNQIIELANIGTLKQGNDVFDTCLMPRTSHHVTDLDIHDITADSKGHIFFVSTQFNSVAQPNNSGKFFDVYWRPPWITDLVAEDRCHLNGLALRDDVPRYVTSVSTSNVVSGWRENRQSGGVVYDIVEDKVVCSGLSMPHSPRWHGDRLWLLESGSGYFGYVENGKFRRKTFIPGFARGLTFYQDQYAIICSSVDRHESLFSGLELGDILVNNNAKAKCGLFVVSLETFGIVHAYTFNRGPVELFDVALVPNSRRTRLIDLYDPLMSTISKSKRVE